IAVIIWHLLSGRAATCHEVGPGPYQHRNRHWRATAVRFAVVGTAALDRCCRWAGRVNSSVGPLLLLPAARTRLAWRIARPAGPTAVPGASSARQCRHANPWPVPATAR